MSPEERGAVKDVVMDKITDNDENVPPPRREGSSRIRYKCDRCPISFTMESNLTEHLS